MQQPQPSDIDKPYEPAKPSEPAKKKPLKFGLSMAVVIICLVAAGVAVYWIKTEPVEQPESNIKISKPTNKTAGLVSSGVEGWQTHRNEEYGFEIKYPNNWKVEDGKPFYSMPFVIFRLKPGCMFTVEVLSKEHADYNEVERFKKEGREWKSITIGDINGTMFEWEMVTSPPVHVNSLQTSIYFNKENNLYRIVRTVKEEGKWSEYINVSDQILSTFKFIKQ